jgi:hypothetical protein
MYIVPKYFRSRIEAEMARLDEEWDLNDYPDDDTPFNAYHANIVLCTLKKMLEVTP